MIAPNLLLTYIVNKFKREVGMKKYILLIGIVMVAFVFVGCSNIKSSNETANDKSTVSTKILMAEEKSDLKKTNIEEARDFKLSLNNGSVIMISINNSNELEVYNIA